MRRLERRWCTGGRREAEAAANFGRGFAVDLVERARGLRKLRRRVPEAGGVAHTENGMDDAAWRKRRRNHEGDPDAVTGRYDQRA
jgi:hypothetical protein